MIFVVFVWLAGLSLFISDRWPATPYNAIEQSKFQDFAKFDTDE
jgi:hypothetical protein